MPQQMSHIATFPTKLWHALIVYVASVFTQHNHQWQMTQALVLSWVFPLFNWNPPRTVPNTILIYHLHRWASHSAQMSSLTVSLNILTITISL